MTKTVKTLLNTAAVMALIFASPLACGTEAEGGGIDFIDSDNDGLSDAEEAEHGSDPHNPDSDGDGISDGDEVHGHGTSPTDADSDDDGVSDGHEVSENMDPMHADTTHDDADHCDSHTCVCDFHSDVTDCVEADSGHATDSTGDTTPDCDAHPDSDACTSMHNGG